METRFTKQATASLERALADAGKLGHTCIGSEHLLLGLLSVKDSAAAKALAEQKITYEAMLESVKEHLGSGVATELSPSDMTPRTQAIIQSAAYECSKRGNGRIGTEHLLFALLLMRDSIAVKLLTASGADIGALGNELMKMMGEDGENSSGRSADDRTRNAENGKNGAISSLEVLG